MEQTGDIITFTYFGERDLLYETHDEAESGDESDEDSVMPLLLIEEEMDAIYSGDVSEDEPMSMEILEDICDGSKSHPSVNRRETRYKIRD